MGDLFTGGASRALGLALVQFVWQGAAISLAIAALFALMRQASSQARYVTGCIGLAAMMIAPIVTFSLSLSAAVPVTSITVAQAALPLAPLTEPAGVHGAIEASETTLGLSSWLPAVITLWSVGVLVLMVRLIGGWVTVRRFRNTASLAVPEVWTTRTAAIARSLGITRLVTIGTSPVADVPTVVGWIRPAILVPASAFAGLSPFQFEAILAHELAHIRRHDYLVNVMQSVAETLLFYHPGVWWLSSRVRAEREHCCDEVAVGYCGDRVAYAGALASLEGLRLRTPILAVAATSGDLLARVQRLLGVQSHTATSPAWLLAGIIAVLPVAAPLVAESRPPALSVPATSASPPATVVLPEPQAVIVEADASTVQQQTRTPVPQTQQPDPAASSPVPERDAEDLRLRMVQAVTLALLSDPGVYFDRQPPTLASLEELLRSARVSKDFAGLSRLLDFDFSSTDPSGTTRNQLQSQEAFRTSSTTDITIESVSGTMLETTAFTTGVQSQVTNGIRERVQFTRVWKVVSGTWKVSRSVEFRIAVQAVAPGPSAGPFRVGGDVREPRLLTFNIRPAYPAAAKAAGLQGLVIIEAIIDPEGNVADARVIKAVAAELDQAALDAVRQWKYTPTLLNGVPVSVMLNVTVNFALAQ